LKFWDREKEIGDLKRYLQSEPNAILFVYGPKSSGKSTLLMKVTEELGEVFAVYWYDLREELVSGYESVLEIFFKERGWKENPFAYMRRELERELEKGKRPVIVFDELQRLKGVYMNSPNNQRSLVDELFNFFVRVTKVLHLAHVLVMTSDTFFIEEVYASSALKNTSEYYLVDYFDDETAFKVLINEGLSEEEARYAAEWIGGVPWMMERVLSNGNVREKIEELFIVHKGKLREFLLRCDEYEKVVEVLKGLLEGREVLNRENLKVIEKMAREEILFYDPLRGVIMFQTKLDERAARELIG